MSVQDEESDLVDSDRRDDEESDLEASDRRHEEIEFINLSDEDSDAPNEISHYSDNEASDSDLSSSYADSIGPSSNNFNKQNPPEKCPEEPWHKDLVWTEKLDGVFVLSSDLRVCRFDPVHFPVAFDRPNKSLHAIGRPINHYKGLKEHVPGFKRLVEIGCFFINNFNVKVLIFHSRKGALPYATTCKAVQQGLESSIKSLPVNSKTRINFLSHIDRWVTVWNQEDWEKLGPLWKKYILHFIKKTFNREEDYDSEEEVELSGDSQSEREEDIIQERFQVEFLIFKSGQSIPLEEFEATQLEFLNPSFVKAFIVHFALDASLEDHHLFFQPHLIDTMLKDHQSKNRKVYRVGLLPGVGNITYEYIESRDYPCTNLSYYAKIHSEIHRDMQSSLTNQIISKRCFEIYGSFFENKMGKIRLNDRDKKMKKGEIANLLRRIQEISSLDTDARVEVVVSCTERPSIDHMLETTFRRARRVLYERKNLKENLQIYKPVKTVEYVQRMEPVWPYIIGTQQYCIDKVYKFKEKASNPQNLFNLEDTEYLTLEDFTALYACDLILQGWLRGNLQMFFSTEWRVFLGIHPVAMELWNERVFAQDPQVLFPNLERIEDPHKRFKVTEAEVPLVKTFPKYLFSKYPNSTKAVLKEINNLKRLLKQAGGLVKFRTLDTSTIEARLADALTSLILIQTCIGLDDFPEDLNLYTNAGSPHWTKDNYNFRLITSKDVLFELMSPVHGTFDTRWKFFKELLKYIKSTNLIQDLDSVLAQAISCATLTYNCPFAIWAKKGHGLAVLPDFNESFDEVLFNNLWRTSLMIFFDEFSWDEPFISIMDRFYSSCMLIPENKRDNLTIDRLLPFLVSLIEGGKFKQAKKMWGRRFVYAMKKENWDGSLDPEDSSSDEEDYGSDGDDYPLGQPASKVVQMAPSQHSLRNPCTGKFISQPKSAPQSRAEPGTPCSMPNKTLVPSLSGNDIQILNRVSPVATIDSMSLKELRLWLRQGRKTPVPTMVTNLSSNNEPNNIEDNDDYDDYPCSIDGKLSYAQTNYVSAAGYSLGRNSDEFGSEGGSFVTAFGEPQVETSLTSIIDDIEQINLQEPRENSLYGTFTERSSKEPTYLTDVDIIYLNRHVDYPDVDQTVMKDLRSWLHGGRPILAPETVQRLFSSHGTRVMKDITDRLENLDLPATVSHSINIPIPPSELDVTEELGSFGSIQTLAQVVKKVHRWQKRNDETEQRVKIHWTGPNGRRYRLRPAENDGIEKPRDVEGDVLTDEELEVPKGVQGKKGRLQNKKGQQRAALTKTVVPPKGIPGLTGLKNMGNTCLSNTKAVSELILQHDYGINVMTSKTKGALIREFARVIKKLRKGSVTVEPFSLKSQIEIFSNRFYGTGQQDAHELLTFLIDGLHEDTNRFQRKPQPISTDIDDSLPDDQQALEAWSRFSRENDSPMVDNFAGQFKSCLRCTTCGHRSLKFEQFWALSIPIGTTRAKLSEYFENFAQEEILDADNMVYCSKCEIKRKFTKTLRIQRFPNVFVLHLKRFLETENGFQKLSTFIDYPLNDLDLSAFASNTSNCKYNLFGVANHYGSINSGHYTAFCLHSSTGQWNCFNDSSVTPISSSKIVSSDGYLLFYQLQTPDSDL